MNMCMSIRNEHMKEYVNDYMNEHMKCVCE